MKNLCKMKWKICKASPYTILDTYFCLLIFGQIFYVLLEHLPLEMLKTTCSNKIYFLVDAQIGKNLIGKVVKKDKI